MKTPLLTLIMVVFFITIKAQSDYNSILRNGIASANNMEFKIAKKTFEKGKKQFKKQKDKAKEKEFEALEKKCKSLEKSYADILAANDRMKDDNYKLASGKLDNAQGHLEKSKSISSTKLSEVENKVSKNIAQDLTKLESDRGAYISASMEDGKKRMQGGHYAGAASVFQDISTKCGIKISDPEYGLEKLISECNSKNSLKEAELAYKFENYEKAYEKYSEINDPEISKDIRSKMLLAQSKVCTGFKKSVLELYDLDDRSFKRMNDKVKDFDCKKTVKANYDTVASARKLVAEAKKLESKQPIKAAAKYQKAYNLVKVESLRNSAEYFAQKK